MLLVFRLIIIIIYCILVCMLGSVYCLIKPRNPNNVAIFSHIFGYLAQFLGLKIEIRLPVGINKILNAVYISNHQSNYDMVTVSNVVLPPTVTIGKRSLLWIPFFGQLYWLAGNLLINRKNHIKAYSTIKEIVNQLKKRHISVMMFPEGTRSRGRGLLPFKTGAFHIATMARVPIIPICVSNTWNKVKLNRLNNGLVIIEMLPPIDVFTYKKNQIQELTMYCYELMKKKIDILNDEVVQREKLI